MDKLRAEGKKYIAPEEENMKALFIGGTGTISMAIVRKLAEDPQWEVWLLNRGRRKAEVPDGIHQITADIHDETAAAKPWKDCSLTRYANSSRSIRMMRKGTSASSGAKQSSISSSAPLRRITSRRQIT